MQKANGCGGIGFLEVRASLALVARISLILLLSCVKIVASEASDALKSIKEANACEALMLGRSNALGVDAAIYITFTATTIYPFDPQGSQTIDGAMVISNGLCAFDTTYTYERNPIYQTQLEGISVRARKSANTVVWRTTRSAGVYGRKENCVREDILGFRVTPENAIVGTNAHSILSKYRINDRRSLYFFERLLLSVGRIPDRYLDKAVGVQDVLPGNTQTLTVLGTAGADASGTWKLTYDPGLGYLIRESQFTVDGHSEPVITVVNSGEASTSNFRIAATGSYKAGAGLRSDFQILSITNAIATNALVEGHIGAVLNYINSISSAESKEEIDYRGPTPKRTIK